MDQLYNDLKNYGQVKTNVPLAKLTTFQVGGPAQFLVEVTETDKLVGLLDYLTGAGVQYFIIGGGSNLLMPDHGFDGVVIKVMTNKLENTAEGKIIAEAGVVLGMVVNLATKNELSGLEWAIGIPGTVGGAVRGNAGAMGKDTSKTIESVTIWRDGEILTLKNNECGFGYRESSFKKDGSVVLSATFSLQPGNKIEIMQKIQEYLKQRTGRYPHLPSAGSFFKNLDVKDWPNDTKDLPPLFLERGKIPVGWLIEQVNMKGHAVGGAKISDEHGNFLVNYNQATQADILKLVEEATGEVYNKFKVGLEPEVEIIK